MTSLIAFERFRKSFREILSSDDMMCSRINRLSQPLKSTIILFIRSLKIKGFQQNSYTGPFYLSIEKYSAGKQDVVSTFFDP